jgi:hypothetical protein
LSEEIETESTLLIGPVPPTATGHKTGFVDVLPKPRFPLMLLPQQFTAPAEVATHEESVPPDMLAPAVAGTIAATLVTRASKAAALSPRDLLGRLGV